MLCFSVLPAAPCPTALPTHPVCLFLRQSSGNASYRCSMSSSADFSDEEDFSQRSGTVSPAPGDTLPWNLPKHERSKRKIQGGSVLDPAERAVLRIAGKARPGAVGERAAVGAEGPSRIRCHSERAPRRVMTKLFGRVYQPAELMRGNRCGKASRNARRCTH